MSACCRGGGVGDWVAVSVHEASAVSTSGRSWCRGCRAPARFRGLACQEPAALCVGARRSSGPSLCRGPVLSVESRHRGPGGPLSRITLSRPGSLCVGPGSFCRGLYRGPAVLSQRSLRRARRSVSGPAAPCVGARRSVCRGSALFVSGLRARCSLCRAPALFVSGPDSLSILLRTVSVSELGALQRFLCRGPALSGGLSVSGPGALCRRVCGGPGVGVFLSGFGGGLYVGPGATLCWGPALCVGPHPAPRSHPRAGPQL